MPASVPLRGHTLRSDASSALDLVIPEDIVAVIEVWEAARCAGAAKVVVHPLVIPDLRLDFHFVDAIERFGVYLGFVIGVPDAAMADGAVAASCARTRSPW